MRAFSLIYGLFIAGISFMTQNNIGYTMGAVIIIFSLGFYLASKPKKKKKSEVIQ